MTNRRIERVNELIMRELGDLIGRTLRDPRMTGMASVTAVETSHDLRHARVFVSILGDEDARRSTMSALTSAAGYLRKELGSRIMIRYTPELSFKLDDSIERGERVRQLLRQVETPPLAQANGTSTS